MPDRFGRPGRRELRSSHLLRLGMAAPYIDPDNPPEGFKMACRICLRSGCTLEEMAGCTPFTVDQLKEWSH